MVFVPSAGAARGPGTRAGRPRGPGSAGAVSGPGDGHLRCVPSRPGRADSTSGVPEPVPGLRGSQEGPGKASEAHFGSLFEASGDPVGSLFSTSGRHVEPNFGT